MIAAYAAQSRRLRVAVLAGGDSHEREISLESGKAVAAGLRARGHEVVCLDPASSPPAAAQFRDIDVAFLALHGRNGEDGQIQAVLDRMGIVYTGSGPEASRLAFSKSASKERFFQSGVATPAYVLVHESDDPPRAREMAYRVGFPLVVKPDTQGSSLGVSLVTSPDSLPEALRNCFRYDSFGLMEEAVLGTEWTLGLIDNQALPLIQIETPRPFFDFTAKYDDDATICHFQFAIGEEVVASIIEAGRNAAFAVGTKGLARVDLRLDRGGRPWVLEVNTIPGLTDHSLIPKAAAWAGVSLGELCERAIERALATAAVTRAPLHGPHRTRAWRTERRRA